VDDEAGFTRLLKLNLEQTEDYEVQVENGAQGALKAAREFQPDLILLDMVMPDLFGGDLAAQLRADAQVNRTPVLFLSAAVGKKRVQEHHGQIGGYPIIAKPASLDEIVTGIERHLVTFGPPGDGAPLGPGQNDATGLASAGALTAMHCP
jgi:DNA-binding response OmpR family regulator